MEKKISKFNIEDFGSFSSVYVQCDKESAGKIAEFIAKLNSEINTPKEKPLQEPPKTNPV